MEKVLDNNYYDLMINNVSIPMYDTGNNITTLNFRHSLAHVLKTNSDPCNLGVYPYHSFPTLYVRLPLSALKNQESARFREILFFRPVWAGNHRWSYRYRD